MTDTRDAPVPAIGPGVGVEPKAVIVVPMTIIAPVIVELALDGRGGVVQLQSDGGGLAIV